MAKGPESHLKAKVKKHLASLPRCRQSWPVPVGYGDQMVDCIACINGRYVAIETKAEGKKPTPRQWRFLHEVTAAGGVAFWCDSFESYLVTMRDNGLLD